MSTTPHIKFEDSPTDSLADSFISTPGTLYPPLFPPQDSLHATECMTPPCDDESSLFGDSVCGSVSIAGTPAPEKKPVKKRKSWGQQLPEPKTNLPPRKRAKTEDEKEQRRVERVLRNRRAAQSSRERKRMEVEALEAQKNAIERRNQDLEMRLADLEAKNLMLQRELEQFTGKMAVFRGSSTTTSPRASPRPVTFSQDLFGPRDSDETPSMSTQVSPLDTQPTRTVNPASLSPEIRPVTPSDPSNASSSDLTQHPAVSVAGATALGELGAGHVVDHHTTLGHDALHQYDLASYFGAPDAAEPDRYLVESGILAVPDTFDLNYDHVAFDHDGVADDFNINEFLHNDEQHPLAPEVQSES